MEKKFADGSATSGGWTPKQSHSWIVVDLQAHVKVSLLRLHNLQGKGRELKPSVPRDQDLNDSK